MHKISRDLRQIKWLAILGSFFILIHVGIEAKRGVQVSNNATSSVTINDGKHLPDSPRTVEQVADYLGVTGDTIRESYIPEWIRAGHMTPEDRAGNRWLIPETFTPYRPK